MLKLVKRQKGGSMKRDATYVAPPSMLTKQQAEDNTDASLRKQFQERMKAKTEMQDLKLKGQTQLGNTISDSGTNMLTLATKFQTPTDNEIQQGRGNWSDRGKLIANATSNHLSNELTAGAMGWVGNKVASGEAKMAIDNAMDKKWIPALKRERILPEKLNFKPYNYNEYYGIEVMDKNNNIWGGIDLTKEQAWSKPVGVDVDPALRGNKLQDVLYQLGVNESKARGLNGIRSGDHLLQPENTKKLWSRMNTEQLEDGIVGITGHKNPNVIEDWMSNYKSINKLSPRQKLSVNDIIKPKLQKGGTLKADNTRVNRPIMLTQQELDDNQAASNRKLYLERQKEIQDDNALKLKGQTKLGNAINDAGTNMLTLTTKLSTPSKQEVEQGRGSMSDRIKLLANSASQGMSNELVGGAMNGIANLAVNNSVGKLINKGVDKAGNWIDDKLYDFTFRNEIKGLTEQGIKQNAELYANDIQKKRISRLGVSTYDFMNNTPKFSSNRKQPTAFYPGEDRININFSQLSNSNDKGYNFSTASALDHELGHRLQKYNYYAKPNQVKSTYVDYDAVDFPLASKENLNAFDTYNKEYFYKQYEPLAHLMEAKRQMLDQGILPTRTTLVTNDMIKQYAERVPDDRIIKFMQPTYENRKKLIKMLNKIPAATLVGSQLIKDEKEQ